MPRCPFPEHPRKLAESFARWQPVPAKLPSVQQTRARAFPFPLGGWLRGPRHQTVTVSVTDGPHQHVIGRTRAHLSPTVASEGMPWNDERNAMTP